MSYAIIVNPSGFLPETDLVEVGGDLQDARIALADEVKATLATTLAPIELSNAGLEREEQEAVDAALRARVGEPIVVRGYAHTIFALEVHDDGPVGAQVRGIKRRTTTHTTKEANA